MPSRPVWGYRVSQGIHVATGIATIPLLLAKLWTVSPKLWAWPPVRSVLHGLERLSILVLVAAAIFEVVTGLINIAQWYPWSFYFPRVHYYVGWVAIGSIALHVAVKAPVIAAALRRPAASSRPMDSVRRGFFARGRRRGRRGHRRDRRADPAPAQPARPARPAPPGHRPAGPAGQPHRRRARGSSSRPGDPGYRLVVAGPRPYALALAELRAAAAARGDAADHLCRGVERVGPVAGGPAAGPAGPGRRPGRRVRPGRLAGAGRHLPASR